MNVPKYIRDLLARSEWAIEAHPCRLPKGCDPGYTILLHKRTTYSLAHTLEKETRTLKNWCDRQMKLRDPEYDPTAHSIATIHHCPATTHYNDQWAVITIYDPLMQHIEQLIPNPKITTMISITKEQAQALAKHGIEYSVGKSWHPEMTEDGMAVVIDEHIFNDEKGKDTLDIHLGRLRPSCGYNYLAALKGLKVKTVNALPCEDVDVVPDWTIEKDGTLVNKKMGYEIGPDQLRDQDDWILHLMEKPWVNLNSFIPAYFLALRRLGIKDAIVRTSYE